jgi:hypothetical protein
VESKHPLLGRKPGSCEGPFGKMKAIVFFEL